MKSRLDTLLGHVTMYRLMIVVLGAIALVAIIASAFGQLFYTPLQLVLSLAVALIATGLSGWIFALAFRTRAHLESSVITGLLVFMIFLPTDAPAGLLLLAVSGIVASASKYLLAIRGRHVLNPAAVAAVVMTVTTLDIAGWWVANPVLLPFVAVGALIVLYRTRKLTVGLVFVVIATALFTARFVGNGELPFDALGLALGSLPIVFLAGFMLSEPLTLPPRRWQQLLVAALVAVVFSIPYQIGPVYSSPEIALLVGNIVAFAFSQRRGIRMRFLGSRDLTPTSAAYDFEPLTPVRFRPGQYLELTLPHRRVDSRGSRRMFSITSAADDGSRVSVGVKLAQPSSSFKRTLAALEPGATVRSTWVGGDFLLPDDPGVPLVFAAGGIGITPFVSQLAERSRGEGRPVDVVLLYSVASVEELAYADELVAAGIRVLVSAPDAPDDLPPGWEYLGPGRLSAEALGTAIPDLRGRRAYVSGPPGYVDHVARELRRAGARAVRRDAFAGY
ncbi:FAD-dependent oxidoreductase [Herbiconiux sp. CPCC 205763]|uniref:FAD-dependent oxidoreductase n=1 Tax=Herbiconiux aconitum TaxID=2970913 RepID=A0ABT2GNS0_9MICO|nr:FAD-dependent oxidoreductase [Herbiconiux aconitum]MCS5717875.1 FAD-dependent oxidoreductase [Herbiconiux aconitum]